MDTTCADGDDDGIADDCFQGTNSDLNGDGHVDGADLTILLSAWGSDDPIADIDGDGIVGGADLTILLSDWTG